MKQNGPGRNTTNANPNFVLTEMIVKVEGHPNHWILYGWSLILIREGFLPDNCLMEIWIPVMDGQSLEFGKAHWVQAEFSEPLVLTKTPNYILK